MKRLSFFGLSLLLLSICPLVASAQFTVGFGTIQNAIEDIAIGNSLDELTAADAGTAVDLSTLSSGLTLTFTGVTGSGTPELSVSTNQIGINSSTGLASNFDSGESFSFQLNQPVSISQADFSGFGGTESITFGGFAIGGDDAGFSAFGDTFTFATPLQFAANTDIVIAGDTGGVGVQNFTFSVATVPEPTSMAVLFGMGLLGVCRRRR